MQYGGPDCEIRPGFFIEIAPPGTEFSIDIFREYDSISTIERKGQAFSIKTGGKKT